LRDFSWDADFIVNVNVMNPDLKKGPLRILSNALLFYTTPVWFWILFSPFPLHPFTFTLSPFLKETNLFHAPQRNFSNSPSLIGLIITLFQPMHASLPLASRV
jgi:hypothetical protein